MANPNAPFGFRPSGHLTGGTPGRDNSYEIASAYGTAIYEGDPVASDGAGNIIKATNATAIIGIFAGYNIIGADGVPVFSNVWRAGTTYPAGTKCEAIVFDDPNTLFLVQCTGTLADKAVNGKLANIDVTGGGDLNTGLSKAGITAVAGSENQFLVHRVVEMPVTVAGVPQMSGYGQYAIAEVSLASSAIKRADVAPASTEY